MLDSIPSNYSDKPFFHIEVKKETIWLKSNNKIFKIKLFDHTHTNLTKRAKNPAILETPVELIKQLFEELIHDQHINLEEDGIKSLRIALNETHQVQILIQQQKHSTEKIVTSSTEILKELRSSFSKSTKTERPIFIEIHDATPSQTLDQIKMIFTDLKGVLSSEYADIKRTIMEDFRHVFTHSAPSIPSALLKRFNRMTGEERYLAHYLRDKIDWTGLDQEKVITEILCGAYVMFEDDGQLYRDWKEVLEDKQSRHSSHQSDGFTQYSIQGEVVKELLFSQKMIKADDGSTRTVSWCQCERYNLQVGEFFQHMGTWLLYKMRRKNQGPLGESIHTEHSTPLILRLKK